MLKKIVKIFIIIILFFILCLVTINVKKFIILSKLQNLSNENEVTNNYSYQIISNTTNSTEVSIIRAYLKEKTFLINGTTYKEGKEIQKYTLYKDEIDKIGILEKEEQKIISINGENSDILTIDGSIIKINELGNINYDELKQINNLIHLKILNDECNDIECYLLKTKYGNKYWIDKNTGIVVRNIIMDNISDYSYEINNVVDEDIMKPAL